MRSDRRLAVVGALLLAAAGCSIDDEVTARLSEHAAAFTPSAAWTEQQRPAGTDEDFPLLYVDGPLCSSENCVHASRHWLAPGDARPDLGAITDAIATTDGWDPVYTPDCDLGERSPADRVLPEMTGCVWEADAGPDHVLVTLHRFGDTSPYRLSVSVRIDEHVRRTEDSPVEALARRAAATDLLAVADRFRAPDDWRMIGDDVRSEPGTCPSTTCLVVVRRWFDAELDAERLRGLLVDAGFEVTEDATSCAPGVDERGLQEDCRLHATTPGARIEIGATAFGQQGTYEVVLTVTGG